MVKKSTKKAADPNFENDLHELEQLIETMEEGESSLEDTLKNFERGVMLTRTCQKTLEEAEQRVQILINKHEQTTLEPFDEDELT